MVVESLAYSSPNVLSDGTLIWTSWAGKTRAQATDGGLRWEADAVEGVALVSDDDVTYWAVPTPIGRDRFGALVWEPRHPPEWRTRSIPQDEGTRVGPLIPVAYDALGVGGIVTLHRRSDGELEYSTSNLDGGLDGDPTRVGIAPDGTTFVSSISADSATAERRTILAAYDNQLRRRGRLNRRRSPSGLFPAASTSSTAMASPSRHTSCSVAPSATYRSSSTACCTSWRRSTSREDHRRQAQRHPARRLRDRPRTRLRLRSWPRRHLPAHREGPVLHPLCVPGRVATDTRSD